MKQICCILVNNAVRSRGVTALLIAHNINPLLPHLDKVMYIANGKVATGRPDEVLTSESLTALYGVQVEVLRDPHGNVAIIGVEEHHGDVSGMTFSINLIADLQQMLNYQFMQHAFEAGTITAIVAGITGYFVVLRRSAFTAHAFSEIGFAGAAGAILINIPPIAGLVGGSVLGGLAIAALGRRATKSRYSDRNRFGFHSRSGIVVLESLHRICDGSIFDPFRRDSRNQLSQRGAHCCRLHFDFARNRVDLQTTSFRFAGRRCGGGKGNAHALYWHCIHVASCDCCFFRCAGYRSAADFLADGYPGCYRTLSLQKTIDGNSDFSSDCRLDDLDRSLYRILHAVPG